MILLLHTFCRKVEQIVRRKAIVEHIDGPYMTGVEVAFSGSPLEVRVLVPEQVDCIVADKVVPGKAENTLKVLGELGRLGSELDTGSVLVSDDGGLPEGLWDETEFAKQYFLPLPSKVGRGSTGVDQLIDEGIPKRFAEMMEKSLNMPVELEHYMNERPYILSLDYHCSAKDGEKPPFHMYLHLHELTGSLYVEKVELPEEKRGKGLGSRLVNYMKWFAREYGFRFLYLEAAKTAEPFWERHGFRHLHRLNLRRERRSARALSRRPGWERSWVGEYRLKHPYWQYKSHPQDDIDLIGGLLACCRAWPEIERIAG